MMKINTIPKCTAHRCLALFRYPMSSLIQFVYTPTNNTLCLLGWTVCNLLLLLSSYTYILLF